MTAVAQNFKNSFRKNIYKLAKLFKVAAVLSTKKGPELHPWPGQVMTLFVRSQS